MSASTFKLPQILSDLPTNGKKLISNYVNHPVFVNTLIAPHNKFKPKVYKYLKKQATSIRLIVSSHMMHQINPNEETLVKPEDLHNLYFIPYKAFYQEYIKDQKYLNNEIIGKPIDSSTKKYLSKLLKNSDITEILALIVTSYLLKASVYDEHHKIFETIYSNEFNKYSYEHDKMLNERKNNFGICGEANEKSVSLNHLIDLGVQISKIDDTWTPIYEENLNKLCLQHIADKIEFLDNICDETKKY